MSAKTKESPAVERRLFQITLLLPIDSGEDLSEAEKSEAKKYRPAKAKAKPVYCRYLFRSDFGNNKSLQKPSRKYWICIMIYNDILTVTLTKNSL